MAAMAYNTVQTYLLKYRHSNSVSKDSPKEVMAQVFAGARRAADEAAVNYRKEQEAAKRAKATDADTVQQQGTSPEAKAQEESMASSPGEEKQNSV